MTATSTNPTLVAVDIGNSRIKMGRFDAPMSATALPLPVATLELPLRNHDGDLDDVGRLKDWSQAEVTGDATWRMSIVHSGAAVRWLQTVQSVAHATGRSWRFDPVTHDEVPLEIDVDAPNVVGMDRLMAALAANRLRQPNRAAIIVDLGTATKVDLVTEQGAFVGGAIMPGLTMSARALKEQTEALPLISVEGWVRPPLPLGKSTVPAIESGLFWGTVGAIRELVSRYSDSLNAVPEVFVTGGASELVAAVLAEPGDLIVRYEPHLVLSGIAIAHHARD